jgi:hypothetical protein
MFLAPSRHCFKDVKELQPIPHRWEYLHSALYRHPVVVNVKSKQYSSSNFLHYKFNMRNASNNENVSINALNSRSEIKTLPDKYYYLNIQL